MTRLARRLGLLDATMIVMGGIVGSGIFINPYIVARQFHSPAADPGAWAIGGWIALSGGFIWAELAARRPQLGRPVRLSARGVSSLGRIHLRLDIAVGHSDRRNGGGGRYLRALFPGSDASSDRRWRDRGPGARGSHRHQLSGRRGRQHHAECFDGDEDLRDRGHRGLRNCVRKAAACWLPPHPQPSAPWDLLKAAGAALTPIAFSYGGWQTSSFMSAELRDPRRDLTRGLLIGVLGVVAHLSFDELRLSSRAGAGWFGGDHHTCIHGDATGGRIGGATFTAIIIAISTLGFLSQGMLTAPRVYFAMAEDGLFFRERGYVSTRTQAPVVAIALQGILAIVIALSGRYEQILSYVISSDFIFFGLTAATLFVFRRRERSRRESRISCSWPSLDHRLFS